MTAETQDCGRDPGLRRRFRIAAENSRTWATRSFGAVGYSMYDINLVVLSPAMFAVCCPELAEEMSGLKPTFYFASKGVSGRATSRGVCGFCVAVKLDQIRSTADRIAASFGLEVVDLELTGAAKFRTLRVFVEKDAAGRAKLAELAATEDAEALLRVSLPKGVPVEMLSGVTHEDCGQFAQDFGTVLDVEDLVPGAEYLLEVSSPGLGAQAVEAGGLRAVYREPGEAADVYAGEREPALARSACQVCRGCSDAGSFGGEAEGQGEEGYGVGGDG